MGKTVRKVRDGTGPYKGSYRSTVGKAGKRIQSGQTCLKKGSKNK